MNKDVRKTVGYNENNDELFPYDMCTLVIIRPNFDSDMFALGFVVFTVQI